jgi:hypothetical protein
MRGTYTATYLDRVAATFARNSPTHDDLLLAVNGPSMWAMQVDAQAY